MSGYLWLIIVVLVVLLLIFIGYLVDKKMKKVEQNPVKEENPEVAAFFENIPSSALENTVVELENDMPTMILPAEEVDNAIKEHEVNNNVSTDVNNGINVDVNVPITPIEGGINQVSPMVNPVEPNVMPMDFPVTPTETLNGINDNIQGNVVQEPIEPENLNVDTPMETNLVMPIEGSSVFQNPTFDFEVPSVDANENIQEPIEEIPVVPLVEQEEEKEPDLSNRNNISEDDLWKF